jgi:TonB-dependent receptor-like protein
MRLPFLVLVTIAPLDACSDTLVTAPPPPVPAPTIVIRGATVPQEPLIIVDGVVVGRSDINPADIEQVEIIKGPAAAALYGAETRCPPIIVDTRGQSSVQVVRNAKRQ